MPSEKQHQQSFYRWVDDRGTVHVVSSLDAVPVAERTRMEQVALDGRATALDSASTFRPDGASLALGFGAGLLLALVLPRSWKGVTRVAVMLGFVTLAGGAYLAYLRRTTGADSTSLLATPSAIIQDAKDAVQKVKERQRLQEQELEELKNEGK